jgi:hypothetical protein
MTDASVPVEFAPRPQRLYTVADGTLPSGLKIAQSVHAVAEFILAHPEEATEWNKNGNYALVLETDTTDALYRLFLELTNEGNTLVPFYEPDLEDRMTAFTVMPTPEIAARLAHLSLACPVKKNPWQRFKARFH